MTGSNEEVNQHAVFMYEKRVLIRETEASWQVDSAALLGNREALLIQHRGESYILRQTRAGKLILTK